MELNKEIMKQMRKIEYALLEQKRKTNNIQSNGKTGNSKNTSNSNKQASNGSGNLTNGNLTNGSNGIIMQQSFQP
jgi:hypothetical protein